MVGNFRGKDLQIPTPLVHPLDRRNNSSKADGRNWSSLGGDQKPEPDDWGMQVTSVLV